jgi:DNA polymerase-3 subunit delta'
MSRAAMSRAAAERTRQPPAEEPDRLEGFAAPREVERVVGHGAARAEFADAIGSGRLHHAWLIVGPEGIGKATLAYDFARKVLALPKSDPGADPSDERRNAVFRKIAGLAHPNFLLLRRSFNEKARRYSQWISIDEVRRLRGFLGHSAAEAGWRVVIVDRADELNQNAANALLKALEEPPARTLFLLVAVAEGAIPVTIRSRCRKLRVAPLPPAELGEATKAALERGEYQVDDEALSTALALSQGSVRRSLELVTGDGVELYRDILDGLAKLPNVDGEGLHRLADRIGGFTDIARFELFFSLLVGTLERLIRGSATGTDPFAEEGDIRKRLFAGEHLGKWAEACGALGKLREEAATLNLDRSIAIMEAFLRLQNVARAAAR